MNSTGLLPVGQYDWYFIHDCSGLKKLNARPLKLTRVRNLGFIYEVNQNIHGIQEDLIVLGKE